MIEIKGKYNEAIVYVDELEASSVGIIQKLVDDPASEGSKIRIMPDVHAGKGCVIGTTMTLHDKVVPFTVGVDIACRVSAFEIVHDSEINLEKLDAAVYKHVPSGFAIRNIEHRESKAFSYDNLRCWENIKDNEERYRKSLGTLGGGKTCDCLRAA